MKPFYLISTPEGIRHIPGEKFYKCSDIAASCDRDYHTGEWKCQCNDNNLAESLIIHPNHQAKATDMLSDFVGYGNDVEDGMIFGPFEGDWTVVVETFSGKINDKTSGSFHSSFVKFSEPQPDKVPLHSENGDLFIKPADLFNTKKFQDTVEKVSKLKIGEPQEEKKKQTVEEYEEILAEKFHAQFKREQEQQEDLLNVDDIAESIFPECKSLSSAPETLAYLIAKKLKSKFTITRK